MKKVTAFVGSARKKNTQHAVVQFMNNLEAYGDVLNEIVILSDYNLGICRGCFQCFERGEEFCPLKDDRDVLMDKIMTSDGVIFASPNYSFQLSGMMKVFLDRFGFAVHRPRYFGKTFTSIVTQGFHGGSDIVKYLDFVGDYVGFNTVKGASLTTLIPISEKAQQKIDKTLANLSIRFHASLAGPAYPVPTLEKLMIFRMGRTSMKQMLDDKSLDFRYYKAKGWLESDYYYPSHLGMFKRAAGHLFDSMAATVRSLIA
jgi:multimeric flavodoxin WrbA